MSQIFESHFKAFIPGFFKTPGFALALGLTVFGLSCFGHGKAMDIQPRLLAAWTKILLAEVMYYCSENHIGL